VCHQYAECDNYQCKCKFGYYGDGITCTGMNRRHYIHRKFKLACVKAGSVDKKIITLKSIKIMNGICQYFYIHLCDH